MHQIRVAYDVNGTVINERFTGHKITYIRPTPESAVVIVYNENDEIMRSLSYAKCHRLDWIDK